MILEAFTFIGILAFVYHLNKFSRFLWKNREKAWRLALIWINPKKYGFNTFEDADTFIGEWEK